jgi:uncharacterized RmlC-like cupin family protein
MHDSGDDHTPAHTHAQDGHDHPHDHPPAERWKHDGVRVIPGDRLDANTAQTPGMFRQAAINAARVGAQKIWAGTVAIQPDAKTGVHHHGDLESVIFVPPYVPHQEINASTDEPLHCVLVRSDNEAVVVNLPDVAAAEAPETVYWVDPIHRHP